MIKPPAFLKRKNVFGEQVAQIKSQMMQNHQKKCQSAQGVKFKRPFTSPSGSGRSGLHCIVQHPESAAPIAVANFANSGTMTLTS
jgi:hypothetical protein